MGGDHVLKANSIAYFTLPLQQKCHKQNTPAPLSLMILLCKFLHKQKNKHFGFAWEEILSVFLTLQPKEKRKAL